ncbi:MAG: hypothetical protein R3314_12905, partial [Longimicrobiales bacterium]|nr:hypothetical protein [Longimicrobiales bacterium]
MNDYLLVALPAPDAREIHLFVDALRRCGARAVEREGDRFVALFPWPEDVDALVADVRSAVRASTTMDAPDPTWERLSR